MEERDSFRICLKQICDTFQKTICQLESDLCDIDVLQHEDELKDFKKVVCENVIEDFKLVAQFLGVRNCTKLMNDFLHLLLTQNGLIEEVETDEVELKSEEFHERLDHAALSASYGPTTHDDENFRVRIKEACDELIIKEEERDSEGNILETKNDVIVKEEERDNEVTNNDVIIKEEERDNKANILEIKNDLLQEPIDHEFEKVCEVKEEINPTETNGENCDGLQNPIDNQFDTVNDITLCQHTYDIQNENDVEDDTQGLAEPNEMEMDNSNVTSTERNRNDLVQGYENTVWKNRNKRTNNDESLKTSLLFEANETYRNDLQINCTDNRGVEVGSMDMLEKMDDNEGFVVTEATSDEFRSHDRNEHVIVEHASKGGSSLVVAEGEQQEHGTSTNLCLSVQGRMEVVHDNGPTTNASLENELNFEKNIENTNNDFQEIRTDVSFPVNEFKSNNGNIKISQSNHIQLSSFVDLKNSSNNGRFEIKDNFQINSKKHNAVLSNKRKLNNKSTHHQKPNESKGGHEKILSVNRVDTNPNELIY